MNGYDIDLLQFTDLFVVVYIQKLCIGMRKNTVPTRPDPVARIYLYMKLGRFLPWSLSLKLHILSGS